MSFNQGEVRSGRRGLVAFLAVSMVAMAPAALPAAADVEPIARSSRPVVSQILAGELPSQVDGDIAVTADGETLALGPASPGCGFRKADENGDDDYLYSRRVVVSDTGPDAPVLRRPEYWYGPGCWDDVPVSLSDDGLTVAASITSTLANPAACDTVGAAGANYTDKQVVAWTRGSRDVEFGDPILISKDSTDPAACYGDADPNNDFGPDNLIGAGGDGYSDLVSVNDNGLRMAFMSRARNLGAAPVAADSTGVFLAELDQTTHDLVGVEMVTPDTFDGSIREVKLSGDASSIVFSAEGTGLVSGVDETHSSQVFVAKAPATSGAPWTIEHISVDTAGAPLSGGFESNRKVDIDSAGSLVSFSTKGTSIETGVSLDPTQSTHWMVVRDMATSTNRVVLNSDAETAQAPGGFGYPADVFIGSLMLTGDGQRLVALAFHDGKTFVRTFNTSDVIDTDLATRRSSVAGGRSILSQYKLGFGVGGSGDAVLVATADSPITEGYEGSADAVYLMSGGVLGDDATRPWHGDPVDTATGEFQQVESDFAAPSGSGAVALTRTYGSGGRSSGIFGPGWATPFDMSLDLTSEDGSVTVELPSGRAVTYGVTAGVYSTTSGFLSQLTRDDPNSRWVLTDPAGGVQRFDDAGQLVSIESPGQLAATLTWDDSWDEDEPRTPLIVSAGGISLTFVDDGPDAEPDGFIDRVESTEGAQVAYGYTQHGGTMLLTKASRAHVAGQDPATVGQRTYEYPPGTSRLTRIVDQVDATRTHQVVENTYDGYGRVTAQTTDTGDNLTFAYDLKPAPPAGLVDAPGFTTVTNGASQDVTVYQYDSGGQVVGITDALGQSVGRGWDGDQPGSSTSRSGVASSYTYDAANRVKTVSQTVGSTTRVTSTVTYKIADTDPTAGSDRRVETSTDAAGVTTTFTYEGASRLPKTVAVPCDPTSLGSALTCPGDGLSTTTYTYGTGNLDGLVTETLDPDGVKTTIGYHSDRSVASTTIYEDDGTPRTSLMAELVPGDAGWPFADPLIARATRSETPGGDVSWTGVDAQGLVRESRDPLYDGGTHKATRTAYRLDGTVESVTDPSDAVTTFDVRRPGDTGWVEVSSIAQVRINTDADGVSSVSKVDLSGDTVETLKGDLAGPMASTVNTYGELGRLLTTVGSDGVTTTYDHDVEGRVTETTVGNDPNSAVHTTTTGYNEFGEAVSTSTPMGSDPDGTAMTRKTTNVYDQVSGRKTAQTEGADGPVGEQLMTGYQYDATGRLFRTIEHRADTSTQTTPS